MRKEINVKTPIFKDDSNRRLIGSADGWIDPTEVQAVVSGTSLHAVIQDASQQPPKDRSGNIVSILHLRGGGRVLVLGNPAAVRAQLLESGGEGGAKLPTKPPTSDEDERGISMPKN